MMTQENKKKELLFKKLPFLLKDMEDKEWIIDSFPFRYKGEQYIVILTRYRENERKPRKYAKAKVEFVSSNNTNNSIMGHIDFFNVYFDSFKEFCDFFGVERGNANRDLFIDFFRIFSNYIPEEKVIDKSDIEKKLIGSRAEGNNPNAIYCYDVRRNGRKEDSSPNRRSIENSNKAQSLRPKLYERYCRDANLSFFFSDKQEDERSDIEIMRVFTNRKTK
ncbi:DUF6037 family protein [Peribacillus frigoritolerans]|uniref:DUF6037 family protein n=1 Tax=Peribacillus frigoritolerans TaxID=450367 RepID=UPI0024C1A6B6|nr:DUF6037 family protein [Peribacillus frigoritolerans]WHX68264.1 DUF6037 family protein [Peribacillus frigoritolerans]